MARRKTGRDISGWLVVDKPAGVTSSAVVNKVRWAFDARKAGHAGTLDPQATGVLAIALGEATKTVPYITDALKAYRFTVQLGSATDTDDAEGIVVARSDLRPTDVEISAVIPQFVGDITQVPPKYSAVKIDGERAYSLARKGKDVTIAERPLYVESLKMIARPDADLVELELVCGKGGYVRAIARDVGEILGCHAHVVQLRRLWSGPFDAGDGILLQKIEERAGAPELDAYLQPLERGLVNLPRLVTSAEGAARLGNGNPGTVVTSGTEFGEEAWASFQGKAIAIGIYRGGELHPTRVFNQ